MGGSSDSSVLPITPALRVVEASGVRGSPLAAVGLAAMPLCVVVTPLVVGVALVVCHGVDLLLPLPGWIWTGLHDVTFALPNLWALLRGRPAAAQWGLVLLMYVVPGALL